VGRNYCACGVSLIPASITQQNISAESLVTDFSKRFPKDSIVNSIYLPIVHGQIAVDRHDSAEALAF
jgi:hypothetical protein